MSSLYSTISEVRRFSGKCRFIKFSDGRNSLLLRDKWLKRHGVHIRKLQVGREIMIEGRGLDGTEDWKNLPIANLLLGELM